MKKNKSFMEATVYICTVVSFSLVIMGAVADTYWLFAPALVLFVAGLRACYILTEKRG